ncbi:MAG: PAS domain-containing protein [Bacteroidota bacterium]
MSESLEKKTAEKLTKLKKKAKFFDFNRIKDKLVAIVVITLITLSLITSIVIYQNSKTKEILDNISALRIPVPILTADIMGGANRVSASQRAYLMTGDDKYKRERLSVWDDQINPAAEELEGLKRYMKVEEHRSMVDNTIKQLKFYQELQNEIDLFFETELKPLDLSVNSRDSSELVLFVERFEKERALDAQLDSLVAGDASRTRKSLRKIIRPLNQAQEDLLVQDNAIVTSRIKATNTLLVIASIIGTLLIIVFSILLLRSLNDSIRKPTKLLTLISKGQLPEEDSSSKDELNDIFQATNLLSQNMRKASEFALDIGNGNFNQQFKPASDEDKLGNSLLQMRDRLSEVAQGDKKRNWVSEGLAQFSDMLRSDISNMESFCRNIIMQLAKYTEANQGAIFIVNNEGNEEYLDLQGCYAWERVKYLDKKIKKGDSLVGQAWLEGDSIYLEEIPDSFIQITSGLGVANPTSMYIIPIKTDQEVVGVLELAFFHKLESHHIEFIEKICSNLASTISDVRINHKTKVLLEQSQQQAEELRAQEEEMRQNIEELAATQEEMNRRDAEVSGQIEAMNNALITIEYDLEGRVITANTRFLKLTGYTLDDIEGKHHEALIDPTIDHTFDDFWNKATQDVSKDIEIKVYGKNGKEIWLNSHYTPVYNGKKQMVKIINFALDITAQRHSTIKLEKDSHVVENGMA